MTMKDSQVRCSHSTSGQSKERIQINISLLMHIIKHINLSPSNYQSQIYYLLLGRKWVPRILAVEPSLSILIPLILILFMLGRQVEVSGAVILVAWALKPGITFPPAFLSSV